MFRKSGYRFSFDVQGEWVKAFGRCAGGVGKGFPPMFRRSGGLCNRSVPPTYAPPKEETIVSVELTMGAEEVVSSPARAKVSPLLTGTKRRPTSGTFRNILMELRKCCNHPYLIKGVEQIEMDSNSPDDEDGTIQMCRHKTSSVSPQCTEKGRQNLPPDHARYV